MNYDAVEISKRYYVAIEKVSGKTKIPQQQRAQGF